MRKVNTFTALGIIVCLPLLMLLQQFLMPRSFSGKRWKLPDSVDMKLVAATEEGLVFNRARAKHIAYAAAVYAAQGKHDIAQKWFLLGSAEFRYPSVMVFYGDYLAWHRRFQEARHWYKLAAFFAEQDKQLVFLQILRKKMAYLEAEERKAVRK
ncbi:MAG: hypothetical protein E7048_04435 [Lentisphaerae bacterium]|nr:hypothetical protein [Lentisphaerota bacterium]